MSGFKSSVNSKIDDYIDKHQLNTPKYNRYNHFFQNNYNDNVIRKNDDYERIKQYIINNPKKWNEDLLKNSWLKLIRLFLEFLPEFSMNARDFNEIDSSG